MTNYEIVKGTIIQIDDEDFTKVFGTSWWMAGDGYFVCWNGNNNWFLGAFLLNVKSNSSYVIDHKDGNKLNYQKHNLRIATKAQNAANSKLRCDSTTGYKGVTFNKRHGKYYAQIRVNYKVMYLGCYETAEEAALKYNEEAKKHFGEFAKLNDVSQPKVIPALEGFE